MSQRVGFAYAQARCQARFALQWREGWERLAGERNAAVFLSAVQQRPFHRLLATLSSFPTAHQTDGFARDLFRRIVAETAGWAPATWRPALRWTAAVVDMPALQFIDGGGQAYPWMFDDKRIASVLGNPKSLARVARRDTVGALRARAAEDEPLHDRWLRHWRRLWPRTDRVTRGQLLRLEGIVLDSREWLAAPAQRGSLEESQRLERELERIFRRCAGTPAALFAYLGLSWLEIARLRAGLLDRQLFPLPG